MIELQGQYTKAKIFTNTLDSTCQSQIIGLLNCNVFENSQVRIMPDVHAGKGSVIGFTATQTDKVIPNVVGVDIGCGMLTVSLGNVEINYEQLDEFIHKNIPSGFNINESKSQDIPGSLEKEIERISILTGTNKERHLNSLGTLGGGNHFIEIAEDKGFKYLVIHSGSRNFGLQIANYHQAIAKENHKHGDVDLAFLENEQALNYLKDMKVGVLFARQNRALMAEKIVNFLLNGNQAQYHYHTVHNFIGIDGIIRKGAISAHPKEQVTIPINMRDGSIIGMGKGNADWNYSAPHGAGRLMGRNQAKKSLSMEDFEQTMSGIYTTSVKQSTLDEAPAAYKSIEEILEYLEETIDVIRIIKPTYNFKA